MANLMKCSRCKSEIDISYFGMNRKKEPYKTCDNCRNKTATTPLIEPYTIVLDVEHTGCKEAYILQLSWGIYNDDGTLLRTSDYFLKPDNYIYINPHVSKITGITYESLLEQTNSLRIMDLLNRFIEDTKHCKLLVAHNMASDIKTINRELMRNNFDNLSLSTYCTMAESKQYCELKDAKNRLKNPKLSELHVILFDYGLDSSKTHNGSYDAEMCAKCYFAFINRKHKVRVISDASDSENELENINGMGCLP